MILDALLSFVPVGSPLSMVTGGTGDVASTNTIDILGNGVGSAPTSIIGNATLFGQDTGIGGLRPQLQVNVGTAFVSGGGGTLQIKFQAAADTGSAGGYLPDTWTTLVQTPALAVANLTAGATPARFDFPPAFPVNLNPRYLRLLFTIGTAAITAGTISSAVVTMVRDDQANRYAPANFAVA